MATTATVFLALLSTLALLAAAEENNILLTGEVLQTGESLLTSDTIFVIQGDCNLVLYGGGFQSNTATHGRKCTLTLNDVGQLVIIGDRGQTVWRSRPSGNKGRYAAVLRPDNVVAIYGPQVWEAPSNLVFPPSAAHARLLSTTSANNLMFSGEILPSGSQLIAARKYRFVMDGDCNLALSKSWSGAWSTKTNGKGEHCFARLGYDGQLAVVDDNYKTVWSSNSKSANGEYVLVLQSNGQAAIYGPIIWTTKNANIALSSAV